MPRQGSREGERGPTDAPDRSRRRPELASRPDPNPPTPRGRARTHRTADNPFAALDRPRGPTLNAATCSGRARRAPWGCSSDGRALQSHCRGQGFDSPQLHQFPRPTHSFDIEKIAAVPRASLMGRLGAPERSPSVKGADRLEAGRRRHRVRLNGSRRGARAGSGFPISRNRWTPSTTDRPCRAAHRRGSGPANAHQLTWAKQ